MLGHISKWMGCHLGKLKQKSGGMTLSYEKSIKGGGELIWYSHGQNHNSIIAKLKEEIWMN